MAFAGSAVLPDTPAGRLGGQLIRHVNSDSAARIREWAPTILSAQIPTADREAFIALLASSARDSGGLDVVDARSDPRQSGMLQVAVRARGNGRQGLLVLTADTAHPDRLSQADLVAMDDPALYAHWPKDAPTRAVLMQLIRTALDQLVRTNDFSGCVTVSDGEQTIFDECRGLAERRFGVPVDHQTKFHIGSMDKMFTAVAIAQLVEAGKLSWDDTLARRVPEYPDQAAAKKITVWQLLHHTSGLGDFLVPELFEHREKYIDPADHLDLIARQPKAGEPGKEWSYSNAGYMLLGRIIENASGESYPDYIRHHVFAPARMQASGFDRLDDVVLGLAVGYYHEGPFSGAWKADWFKTLYRGGPAGGGYSTNADLLRFSEALRAGRLVKSATLARMFDDEVPAGPGGYAAGFGDRPAHGRHVRGHAGGIEGTDANLAIVWETGATVALTSNQGPGQSWFLAERIADLLAAEGNETSARTTE
ncbi:MAG: beta-lactamase family protein [Proteobacteria bacterium]|nr:beta-lactamase family protein [Pseudomonadota bacterium]